LPNFKDVPGLGFILDLDKWEIKGFYREGPLAMEKFLNDNGKSYFEMSTASRLVASLSITSVIKEGISKHFYLGLSTEKKDDETKSIAIRFSINTLN